MAAIENKNAQILEKKGVKQILKRKKMLLLLCVLLITVSASQMSEHDRFMKTASAIAQNDSPSATLPLEARQVIKKLIVDATGHLEQEKIYGPAPGAK
jgi:hypothetical protein